MLTPIQRIERLEALVSEMKPMHDEFKSFEESGVNKLLEIVVPKLKPVPNPQADPAMLEHAGAPAAREGDVREG